MYRIVIREFLGVIILLQLRRHHLSGYDLILLIHGKFGVLLSSGTVYSCLYALEREGLVKAYCGSRKRIYELTSSGEHETTELLSSRAKISALVLQILNC